MGIQEARGKGPEDLFVFEQPQIIKVSPSSEDFRQQLEFLDSYIDNRVPMLKTRFNDALVSWDGVNRLGEQKWVDLVATVGRIGVFLDVSIVFPEDGQQKILDVLNNDDSVVIELTSRLERAEDKIFVGPPHNFLNYFQTVCKAVEDCLTFVQIKNAAQAAQLEVPESTFKRWLLAGKSSPYSRQLYEAFVRNLATQRFSAY